MDKIAITIIIITFLNIIKNYDKPIIILISLELVLISIALLFLNTSFQFDDLEGYLTTFYLLVISAAEASIGLSLILFSQMKLSKGQ